MFIGSSSEGLALARAAFAELSALGLVPDIWTGLFQPGRSTWAELDRLRHQFDAALLVMTPDDVNTKRDVGRPAPRDNLVLELGLFGGALGAERVFFLVPDHGDISLPSDLHGITYLTYLADRPRGHERAAVMTACDELARALDQRLATGSVRRAAQPVAESGFVATGVHRSDGLNHVEVWRVGRGGTVEHRWLPRYEGDPTDWSWSPWERMQCPVDAVGVAAVCGWREDHVEVFVLGTDGDVWHRWWWLEPRWSEWHRLPGAGVDDARGITAASRRPGRMDVYVAVRDGAMWCYEYREGEDAGWSEPYKLPSSSVVAE